MASLLVLSLYNLELWILFFKLWEHACKGVTLKDEGGSYHWLQVKPFPLLLGFCCFQFTLQVTIQNTMLHHSILQVKTQVLGSYLYHMPFVFMFSIYSFLLGRSLLLCRKYIGKENVSFSIDYLILIITPWWWWWLWFKIWKACTSTYMDDTNKCLLGW